MWYWIFDIILALWVLFDCRKRMNSYGWVAGTLFIGILTLPVYLAKRNLLPNETREGGTAWNVLKNFALLWTLFMLVAIVIGISSVSQEAGNIQNEYEAAGFAIGATLGAGALVGLWLFVMIIALVLGLFLRKSSVVEQGPTGKLKETGHLSMSENGTINKKAKRPLHKTWWVWAIVVLVVLYAIGSQDNDNNGVEQASSGNVATPQATTDTATSKTTKKPDLELIESSVESDAFVNYVVGVIQNNSNKKYGYVQVEINLYDKDDNLVGSTLDNVNNLDPGTKWKFKAVVFQDNAATYEIKDITGF